MKEKKEVMKFEEQIRHKVYKVMLIRKYEENLCINFYVRNVEKNLKLMIKEGNFALLFVPMEIEKTTKQREIVGLNLIVPIVIKKFLGCLATQIKDFAHEVVRVNIILIIKKLEKNLMSEGQRDICENLKKESLSEIYTPILTEELYLKMSSKKNVGYVPLPQLNTSIFII